MTEPELRGYIRNTDSGALYGKPGLSLLLVQTPLCRAVIAPQGAQILEFQGQGREPLLWLSPLARFALGQSIRGGIPVCLPWFGINRDDPSKPKHGLVRTALWRQGETSILADGTLELVFTYRHPGDQLFATPFLCQVKFQLGRVLQLQLILNNLGAEPAAFSWAWHSYFAVGDASKIAVEGLEHCEYLDNTRNLQRYRLSGLLSFPHQVDRIFEQAPARQRLVTENPITAVSENCHSVIAWNPGPAAGLEDVGEHHREFVCVEHGNAFADSWTIPAGEALSAGLMLER
ncbi:D-hexose-6-phosphate mutarotase [Microbulbifer sp. 2201CG32-9]|uniref:D-hexose-6-phosphate mutarotase n=1 Tax=unclassified Microbulbifer TaxID=2619833 RepID=UPI00345B7233